MSWKPPHLFALVIASMACWLERQAAAQIEYLKAENRALRSRIGGRRIQFSDTERRALGALGHSQSKGINRRSRLGGMLNFYQRAVA
jgi:hypothetical protein